MGSYKVYFNNNKTEDHEESMTNLNDVKDKAKGWLARYKEGSVEIFQDGPFDNSLIATYFNDAFTHRMSNTHDNGGYFVGVNTHWPFFRASDLTSARIKACQYMKANHIRGMCIFSPVTGGFRDVGMIITNGSRYEYINDVGKHYTLNPDNGRIGKY